MIEETISANAHKMAEAARLAEILGATAIGLIGGTVAITISTAYSSYATTRGYFVHLLFIPAWIFLGISVYNGFGAQTEYLGELISKPNADRVFQMNSILRSQISWLGRALVVLAVWLLAVVIERWMALRIRR